MNLLRPLIEEQNEPLLYELARRITREFDEHTSWQVYPDVFPVLTTLKAHNYILGVISDWGIALGPILRRLHLTSYFIACWFQQSLVMQNPRQHSMILHCSGRIASLITPFISVIHIFMTFWVRVR